MIWARIRARNAVTSVQVSRRLTFAIRAPFDKSSRITYNENCRPSCTWQTPPQPTLLKDTSFKELPKPPRCRFYADVAYEELETYSRDDLTKLSRKQLQYICKVLGINQGIKVCYVHMYILEGVFGKLKPQKRRPKTSRTKTSKTRVS